MSVVLAGGLSLSQPGIGFDNPFCDRVARQAGNIVDAQLIHHLLTVLLDRFDADAEFGGDLFVGAALGN